MATTSDKTDKKASGTAKPAAKATAKATKAARTPSKAREAAKKTTATRTATKKAASTKAATTAKPAVKPAAKAPAKKTAAAKKAPKTETKPAAKKPAAKSAAKAAKPTAKKAAKPVAKAKQTPKSAASEGSAKKTNVTSKIKAVAEARKAKTKPAPEEVSEDDKPKIAPAPLRPALKVARRAEANRDKNQTFKVRTKIVYPAHGVGYITEIEKQEIAGHKIELFVIDFEHEKMKLRVPVQKAAASGMRNLAKPERLDEMLEMIEGKARVKRTMWSRRAQEYEAKINSGDLQAVCEVVRDLFRADDQPEQSYSERQLFEQARERLGRELAAVRRKSLESAIKEIHVHLDRKERPEAAA